MNIRFFAVVLVTGLMSLGSQAAVANETSKQQPVVFSEYQLKTICNSFLSSYEGAASYVAEFSGLTLEEAYPSISCKSKADNLREWQLVAYALTDPPSNLAFFSAAKFLKKLHKSEDVELLNFIYSYRDNRDRGIYEYIELLKDQRPTQRSYYAKFERMFKKFDVAR